MDPVVPQKPDTSHRSGEPASIGGRPMPHLDSGGNALAGLAAATTNPDHSPQPNLKEDIVADLHKDQPIARVRTFESDTADIVKGHSLSAVSIAARKIQQPNLSVLDSDESSTQKTGTVVKKVSIIFAALLILGASVAMVVYAFIIAGPKSVPTIQPPADQSALIATDNSIAVSVPSQETTLDAWLKTKASLATEKGTLVQITFTAAGTTTAMSSQMFLTNLGATTIPSWFIRSIASRYIVGFYNDNSNWDPFMVLSVASYDNAFAGMLQWENGIAKDLAPLYVQAESVSLPASTSTTAATISGPTTVTLSTQPTFSDTFIDNKNVRILGVVGQQPLLLYSFPEQNVLVITTSQAAITEIFNRLVARQFAQ